jgi:beta-lactamase class D
MQTNKQSNRNSWITQGILISCKHKRDLYTQLQNNNNPITISHYKKYSKILTAVIKKSKHMEYDKLILTLIIKLKLHETLLIRNLEEK